MDRLPYGKGAIASLLAPFFSIGLLLIGGKLIGEKETELLA